MEKSSKQFEEWVTKWETLFKVDGFLFVRLKLTFFYFITATIILVGSSLVLYNTLLSRISYSIRENIPNPFIAETILDRTRDILKTRFLTIDIIILLCVIIIGFFLTKKTLEPIKISMQKQKRFIADASHELRTPITIAISGLEVAIRSKNLNIDGAKDTLSKTLGELQELSRLTNHLLDITKYNSDILLPRESLEIGALVSGVAVKMKSISDEKGVNLKNEIKSEALILGNKVELERVIFNIINNAITHTLAGGEVLVSNINENDKYIISIIDTGVGISEENLTKVFDPFFQGDISRNMGGTGLGLTLAKKIIENHDGKITLRSEVGKGTEVRIAFPVLSKTSS